MKRLFIDLFKKKIILVLLFSVLFLQNFVYSFAAQSTDNSIKNCKNKIQDSNFIFEEFSNNCVEKKGLNDMLLVSNVINRPVVSSKNQNSYASNSATSFRQNVNQSHFVSAPLGTLQAYNNISFRGGNMHLNVKYITPNGISVDFSKAKVPFKKAYDKISNAVKNDDPNYSWVNLPEKLLKENYVDNVYKIIEEFKKPFGEDSKLIFVALGNPANADEMVKASGLGHKMVYSCDITPAQIRNTINKAGGNLDKIQVIISSKSGSTFESNQTFKLLVDELTEHYTKQGVKPEEMQEKISKHFLCLTDKNPDKSKLKREAMARGFKTVDCVEGHSGFADMAYSMPTLAYVGLPKQSAITMLKAADNMSKTLMKDTSLEHNLAAQMAAYDFNPATKQRYIFHDNIADFSNTEKQLNQEHLRELSFATDVYPRDAHSGLESAISMKLPGQQLNNITNVVTRVNYKLSEKEASYLKEAQKLEEAHIRNAQQEGHYQKQLILEMGPQGIAPESLGEFEMLKSFNTYYTNEFKHNGELNIFNIDYVNGYKKIRESL